ncbi:hypothetical protein L2E82_47139 [Cichorium intybus]|uniref:Uncharacterized protein n=1 Tax=Cichorium intybus TaxID=13427 RepID=A0ACB8YTX1_CICIN|nr:hypothetical protein L2E82_47139 [Cichorium intybus]
MKQTRLEKSRQSKRAIRSYSTHTHKYRALFARACGLTPLISILSSIYSLSSPVHSLSTFLLLSLAVLPVLCLFSSPCLSSFWGFQIIGFLIRVSILASHFSNNEKKPVALISHYK